MRRNRQALLQIKWRKAGGHSGLESQIEEKQNQINSLRQQIADAQSEAQAQIQQAQTEAKAEADAAYDAAVAAADQEYQKAWDEYNNVTKKDYDQKLSDLKTKLILVQQQNPNWKITDTF